MAWFTRSDPAQQLSVADAIPRVESGDLTLIDVREVAEVRASGRAKGALNVPLTMLSRQADPRHPDHIAALDPARPVALYCLSGARSNRAADMLRHLGYTQVYNLGGLRDWQAAGGAITA
jgi:rhodanese-related sulfurtransferase